MTQNACILYDRGGGGEQFVHHAVFTVPNTLDGRGMAVLFLTVHYTFAKFFVWEWGTDTIYHCFRYAHVKSVKTQHFHCK
jgi:hypothetical protein